MTRPASSDRSGGHEARHGRRLWLVRHGETVGNSAERYFGATDVPLSELGREQVRRLIPLLEDQEFAFAVHSPLSRAAESARILLDSLRRPPSRVDVEDGLREVDFGDLEGRSAEEIAAERPDWFARWQTDGVDRYPGGESLTGFAERVGGAMDGILSRHSAGDLLVVVHRGVIKAALRHLLRLPSSTVRGWSLDLASASILVDDDHGGWALDRYNLVGPEIGPGS